MALFQKILFYKIKNINSKKTFIQNHMIIQNKSNLTFFNLERKVILIICRVFLHITNKVLLLKDKDIIVNQ